jgi:hypothetical protein
MGDDFVAHDVYPGLNVTWDCRCSAVVVGNEFVGAKRIGFRVVGSLIDFEKVHIVH